MNDQAGQEFNFPVFHEPMMPLEIQEDDLMNDKETQQKIEEDAAQDNVFGPQNLQVGYALVHDSPPLNLSWLG